MATPPFSPQLLDKLDGQLKSILDILALGKDLAKAQRQAKTLCRGLTYPDDAFFEDDTDDEDWEEKCTDKLLLAEWGQDWRKKGMVADNLLGNLKEIVTASEHRYLRTVVRELVRFVVDGTKKFLRQEIATDLHTALGSYLSIRGVDLPSARDRTPAAQDRIPAAQDRPPATFGPRDDGLFYWDDTPVSLSKLAFRFAGAVWRAAKWSYDGDQPSWIGRAPAHEVVMAVWGDEEKESTTLKSTMSRLNDGFLEAEANVNFSKDGDYVEVRVFLCNG